MIHIHDSGLVAPSNTSADQLLQNIQVVHTCTKL